MDIKTLRHKAHLSQEDLAEKAKLSLRTIQRVESGHRVSFASLRALASTFAIDVDELERQLYSLDKASSQYGSHPLWLRLYLGQGWFSASRRELKKIEMFFLIMAMAIGGVGLVTGYLAMPVYKVAIFGFIACLLGAYNASVSIRVGDKFDVWSKLEAELPTPFYARFKKQ